jgi:LysM domain-containing protein
MPPAGPDPNLRLLAPALLAVFVVAALAIVLGSGVLFGGDSGAERSAVSDGSGDRSSRADRRRRVRGRATYTVRAGDTLARIAERTGTSVERLQELNPDLDPQAMSAGQRIRLRE